jgi:hypothetical protein
MSNNWEDVKNNNKKNFKEETYFLSNILYSGGCMRCINKSCKINDSHGCFFPTKISTFVQNPTYINGIEKSIQDAKLDFNGKKPFFTTCNYINKRCRNCEEGRIKYITFNNQKIALCYPLIDTIRFKVTIGLHIDIKLILRGHRYEVSAIPINIFIENKISENLQIDKKELSSEESWPLLCKDTFKSENNFVLKNKKLENLPIDKKELIFEEKIPLFSKDTFKSKDNVVIKNKELENLQIYHNKLNPDIKNVLDIFKLEKTIDTVKNYDSNEKIYTNIDNKILKDINFVDNSILIEKDKEIKELNSINNYLKNEVKVLYDKNISLNERNKKEIFIIKNQNKYNEILENVKYLNTRITQQFFENNYDKYILI